MARIPGYRGCVRRALADTANERRIPRDWHTAARPKPACRGIVKRDRRLKPKLYNGPYEDWEIEILRAAVRDGTPWAEVAKAIPRRTPMALGIKAKKLFKVGRWNPWTQVEDALLRKYYPALGWKGVIRHWPKDLPERTLAAIHRRAATIGLSQKREHDQKVDRVLRECYADGITAPVKRAAKILNIGIKRAQHRARVLGLSVRPQPVKPWSKFEIAILEKHPEYSAVFMSKHLKKAGYSRTPNAVVLYRCKTGISGIGDYMSPSEVGKLLGGYDNSAVLGWIRKKLLKAKMRGYETDKDHYLVSQESLKNFVVAYPHRLKQHWSHIDPTWLIRGLLFPEKGGDVHTERQRA